MSDESFVDDDDHSVDEDIGLGSDEEFAETKSKAKKAKSPKGPKTPKAKLDPKQKLDQKYGEHAVFEGVRAMVCGMFTGGRYNEVQSLLSRHGATVSEQGNKSLTHIVKGRSGYTGYGRNSASGTLSSKYRSAMSGENKPQVVSLKWVEKAIQDGRNVFLKKGLTIPTARQYPTKLKDAGGSAFTPSPKERKKVKARKPAAAGASPVSTLVSPPAGVPMARLHTTALAGLPPLDLTAAIVAAAPSAPVPAAAPGNNAGFFDLTAVKATKAVDLEDSDDDGVEVVSQYNTRKRKVTSIYADDDDDEELDEETQAVAKSPKPAPKRRKAKDDDEWNE